MNSDGIEEKTPTAMSRVPNEQKGQSPRNANEGKPVNQSEGACCTEVPLLLLKKCQTGRIGQEELRDVSQTLWHFFCMLTLKI